MHRVSTLDGRAVQDVETHIDEASQRPVPAGTTIRCCDPKIDAWHSVWLSPEPGAVMSRIGRTLGSQIVLEGKDERGDSIRGIFSEITSDSFRWREEELRTPPSVRVLYEEMRLRRALADR